MKFQILFSALNGKKIRYIVAGGIAVNLYGIERATADIDLVLDLEERNLHRFVKVLKEIGFRPKMPVKIEDFIKREKREKWVKEKGMKVFSLYNPKYPFLLLDVLIVPTVEFETVFKARERIKAGRIIIPVVPVETLIEMKKKTDRPQDKADVFYLKKILKEWKK